ncbi:MAG: sodium:calcium antiporter [Candidatus Woesearchaeota archaeon]
MAELKEAELGLSWYIMGSALFMLLVLEFTFGAFTGMTQLFKLFVIAAITLFVIIQSANYAVGAISSYAKTTGISDYLIGFLVVSIGTTFPDISTSIFASIANQGSLVLGEVLGASIFSLTFVLGFMAIIGGKVKIDKSIQKTLALILTLSMFAIMLGIDGIYSRVDGFVLLTIFLIYVFIMVWKEGQTGKLKKSVPFKFLWTDIVVFGGALSALLLSARWLVITSSQIAEILEVPSFFIGLVLVAIGNTVPEFLVSIKALLEGAMDISIGNLVGSIILNFYLVLGIAAAVAPIYVEYYSFMISAWLLLFLLATVLVFSSRKAINRWQGFFYLLAYVIFVYAQIKVM